MTAGAPGRPLNARWDDDPTGYDHVRTCHLNDRRTAFVAARLTDGHSGGHVVEIGSGTGWLLRKLAVLRPDLRFTGVEPLENYVRFAVEATCEQDLGERVGFVRGTAEGLEAALSGATDAPRWVLTNDVLHHVADVPAAVRATTAIAAPGARWLAIEPNAVNPYVFAMHTIKRGEAVFRSGPFLDAAGACGWTLRQRSRLFLVPPFVRRPPAWATRLEARFEHVAPIAGGLALELSLG
jgi:2-polyprenyl-3-methyl-5-hydroxy-6-metoxy-1,4-benzoquinol methylase